LIDLNGTLLFQFVNFFILVAILAKFAYKPILKVLEDRRNKIATDISSAEEARATAEKLKADYEAQLQKAHTEAQAIVDKAVKQADKEAQAQLDAIRAQIAREKEIAQAEIVNEREAAIREMRNEVVTLSMAVAEKLLQKNMDTDMNQKLVAECLKSFDKQAAAGKQG
jgi:ATP synthase F0, B subunit